LPTIRDLSRRGTIELTSSADIDRRTPQRSFR
jgi:hypothetical protein